MVGDLWIDQDDVHLLRPVGVLQVASNIATRAASIGSALTEGAGPIEVPSTNPFKRSVTDRVGHLPSSDRHARNQPTAAHAQLRRAGKD